MTAGDTIIMTGKATINDTPQAFSHTPTKSLTIPRLIKDITRDIMPDMNKAMKKEKTMLLYLWLNI